MMVKMPGDEGNVDVAGLADRLAVVERFEHREEALALLRKPGEGVEIAGALVSRPRARPRAGTVTISGPATVPALMSSLLNFNHV